MAVKSIRKPERGLSYSIHATGSMIRLLASLVADVSAVASNVPGNGQPDVYTKRLYILKILLLHLLSGKLVR